MLDLTRIRAITLDLDDTLWPIWPTIERAEKALADWLGQHAPRTAQLFAGAQARHDLRQHTVQTHPQFSHDLSALRRESIRLAMHRAGENPLLADAAFEVFFAERQRVELYSDALPALVWLAQRYPLVALSNGNADVHRVGLGAHFMGSVSAAQCGVSKPDARIFEAAAACAGVRPAEVLHVGDDAEMDVLGALGAGMQAVWVNRHAQPWRHAAPTPHHTVNQLNALCDALA